ncbi:hypothetical protein Moror_12746 [Moniliophthora roreri MCA 2997]|uniref:Uncharacterized protein n=2 Tax=Moniliophthora roreri TaxID=221103 RepID=V2XRI4_MONRO|nr:hypothetical protein Moror_12746 [Moniliophthora roreri MCA 2997]KAI3617999.1 hypothetical protein WG66_005498 [Moniliophthora roreri]
MADYYSRAMRGSIAFISLVTVVMLLLVARRAATVFTVPRNHIDPAHSSPLSFSPKFSDPVAMHYEATTVRYGLEGPESDEEFEKLLPAGGHTVHITSPSGRVDKHTVTLFHQLKCLDIIRREYGDSYPSTPELTQHCLTYLHQSILCRPYIALEVTRNVFATGKKSREVVCRDWEAVYREAERNWAAYKTSTDP